MTRYNSGRDHVCSQDRVEIRRTPWDLRGWTVRVECPGWTAYVGTFDEWAEAVAHANREARILRQALAGA